MSDGRVLVIIPACNEAASLPHTLDEVRARAPGMDLLVVDDGSRDDTARAPRDRHVPVLRHVVNLGVVPIWIGASVCVLGNDNRDLVSWLP